MDTGGGLRVRVAGGVHIKSRCGHMHGLELDVSSV